MATTVMYPGCLQGMGSAMRKKDDEDLVYKGPWVRTACRRRFPEFESLNTQFIDGLIQSNQIE